MFVLRCCSGVLVYLITQGRNMVERGARESHNARADTDADTRSVAAPGYKGVDDIVVQGTPRPRRHLPGGSR